MDGRQGGAATRDRFACVRGRPGASDDGTQARPSRTYSLLADRYTDLARASQAGDRVEDGYGADDGSAVVPADAAGVAGGDDPSGSGSGTVPGAAVPRRDCADHCVPPRSTTPCT